MIKYPVRVQKDDFEFFGDKWTETWIMDSTNRFIVDVSRVRSEDIQTIVNALNAMHEFGKLPVDHYNESHALQTISDWYYKFKR